MTLLEFQCQHRFAHGFQLDVGFESNHHFTALFGPSGSGKTTILNAIAGFFRPARGVVRLSGRALLETPSGVWVPPERRKIGFVFQDALLFPHLTVEGNLRYGLPRCGKRPPAAYCRAVEVLELSSLLRRYPHNLSGGEKQRVALGRALLRGPELLLMDEPLASLDDPLKGRVLGYLERAVAEWQVPVLYVTHSQAEVRRAAGWVIVVQDGRLVGAGSPDDALVQPVPLAWTNSTGPVNLLRIDRLSAAENHCLAHIGERTVILPPNLSPSGSAAFIQFRPADVMLSREDVSGLSRATTCPAVSAAFCAWKMPSSWPSISGRFCGQKSRTRRWPNCNWRSVATSRAC